METIFFLSKIGPFSENVLTQYFQKLK